MILNSKITVKNYKCFDSTGGGFDRILPISLIIGKNNSGKSSLLDLINFLIKRDEGFLELGRDGIRAEVLIEHTLTEQNIAAVFSRGARGGGIYGDHFEYGKRFVGHTYTYKLEKKEVTYVSSDPEIDLSITEYFRRLAKVIPKPFLEKIYCHISAERDIVPEKSDFSQKAGTSINLRSNGLGATEMIQKIINLEKIESKLVEKELLNELNAIINPDIEFTRIVVQLKDDDYWEIFFYDAHEKRIALSKMGSGVKTILLVLLNLIVRPKIENKGKGSYVFAFEELENNLHPALQRRLYNYIREYSKKHSTYFFLTTLQTW